VLRETSIDVVFAAVAVVAVLIARWVMAPVAWASSTCHAAVAEIAAPTVQKLPHWLVRSVELRWASLPEPETQTHSQQR
jgi:hypothetical protein